MPEITQKDIYIKDEGDFGTVIFITEKAKSIYDQQRKNQPNLPSNYKLDVMDIQLYKILSFAVSHNLSVDSEMDIIVPSSN